MVWNNPPPILCMATDTAAELENASVHCNQPSCKHKLDDCAEAVVIPDLCPLHPSLARLSCDPHHRRINAKPMAYVDTLVDDFLGLAQGPAHTRRHVWHTLLHTLYKVLQPLDSEKMSNQKEVLYLKNLNAGDYTFSTYQVLLG